MGALLSDPKHGEIKYILKKVFKLGGPLLPDPKHGEALFTFSKHCDL